MDAITDITLAFNRVRTDLEFPRKYLNMKKLIQGLEKSLIYEETKKST